MYRKLQTQYLGPQQACPKCLCLVPPHSLSLSDTPSPWKGYRLPQRQDGLLQWLLSFFPSLLIHLGLNPQNLEDEGKGQRTEPRWGREDASKDGPIQEALLAWFTSGEWLHVGLRFYCPSDLLPPRPGPHPHPLFLPSSGSLTSPLLFPPQPINMFKSVLFVKDTLPQKTSLDSLPSFQLLLPYRSPFFHSQPSTKSGGWPSLSPSIHKSGSQTAHFYFLHAFVFQICIAGQ